ncbi:MAG: TIGR00296 family protein [archaeon]
MTELYSLNDAEKLVKLSRRSIEFFLHTSKIIKEVPSKKELMLKRGVFVSLHTFPERELRGCIGYPLPVKPLWLAVTDCALKAAFKDPRFIPLTIEEVSQVVLDVSILTIPTEFKGIKQELPKKVVIGKHGLIIEKAGESGLLLPQVATELKLDSKTFLEEVCWKADLYRDAWLEEDAKISLFEAQIFKESEPNGKIIEETLISSD